MNEKYKIVILDIDRKLLSAGTQEANALVETLGYVRENLSDVLIVAVTPDRPGFAFLLGYPSAEFSATKSTLLSCLLADVKIMGGTLEAKDILYLSSTEKGHENNRQFCNFVNVGDGYAGIRKALEHAFGTDIFERAKPKTQDTESKTPDARPDTQDSSCTAQNPSFGCPSMFSMLQAQTPQAGPTLVEKAVIRMGIELGAIKRPDSVSDLPKPKWFGARWADALREKCGVNKTRTRKENSR